MRNLGVLARTSDFAQRGLRTLAATLLAATLALTPGVATAAKFRVTAADGTVLEDAVVIVRADEGQSMGGTAGGQDGKIVQRGLAFVPRVLVVRKGAKVEFPNYDQSDHQIYSFSAANRFELPLYTAEKHVVMFQNEGIITLKCNIHDWMLGFIVVVDYLDYGISDSNGMVDADLPTSGDFRIQAWHPSLGDREGLRSVTPSAGDGSFGVSLAGARAFPWRSRPLSFNSDDYGD